MGGGGFKETPDDVNFFPYILHRDMISYVQHLNALRNDDHTDDGDAPGNGDGGVGEDEVLECDINNYLRTVLEVNNDDFILSEDTYEDPENDSIEWS